MLTELISLSEELPEEPRNFANCGHRLNNGLPDDIWCYAEQNIAFRDHLNLQFHYVLQLNMGDPCEVLVNDKIYLVRERTFFLIGPYMPYRFRRNRTNIHYVVASFAADPDKMVMPRILFQISLTDDTLALTQEFLAGYLRKNDYWENSLCLSRLLNALSHITDTKVVPEPVQTLRCFSADVAMYVHDHIASVPTVDVEQIAAFFHCSKSNLRRRFKLETGLTLGEFIKSALVSYATLFLTQNEKNVSEVAELCGYSSIQSFTRMFKHVMKQSPSDYRARYLKRGNGL